MAEAACRAALMDREHAERTRTLIEEERQYLLDRLSALPGLRFANSVANFLFAECDRPAREICDWFLDRKILLRNCSGLPGISGEAIRFAVRTRAENDRFAAAAEELFCGS
jgi:histidinol-phosphate/aromatic aminotransferase/cobyric acid decarboxylase-like protein